MQFFLLLSIVKQFKHEISIDYNSGESNGPSVNQMNAVGGLQVQVRICKPALCPNNPNIPDGKGFRELIIAQFLLLSF